MWIHFLDVHAPDDDSVNEVVRALKSVYAVEMKSKNIQLVDNVLIAETGGSR